MRARDWERNYIALGRPRETGAECCIDCARRWTLDSSDECRATKKRERGPSSKAELATNREPTAILCFGALLVGFKPARHSRARPGNDIGRRAIISDMQTNARAFILLASWQFCSISTRLGPNWLKIGRTAALIAMWHFGEKRKRRKSSKMPICRESREILANDNFRFLSTSFGRCRRHSKCNNCRRTRTLTSESDATLSAKTRADEETNAGHNNDGDDPPV